jgi:hypothetical protein
MPGVRPVHAWGGHRELWDYLLTAPAGPQLHLVGDAQEIRKLDLLPHLLGDEFDGSYVVFQAEEDDFRRDGKQLIGPLAALRDSRHGQLVRCATPASEEDAAAIVASWWPGAGRNIAAAMLTQCGGSLTRAWHAADKAVRAGIAPDVRVVPSICVRDSHDSYADLLLAGDRRGAMNAARLIARDEAGGVISLLAARLVLLPLVREAVDRREPAQETVRRLKADAWVLRQLRPHALKYDYERVCRCREVLAVAETAWRSGARDGVLEAIAALW